MVTTFGVERFARRLFGRDMNEKLTAVQDQFTRLGVVHFEPCQLTERWLARAKQNAEATYRSNGCAYEYEDSWVQHHSLPVSLPPNRLFQRFIRQLFPNSRQLKCETAHLSSLDPGYPMSNEHRRTSQGRHVDGAISDGQIMWHGAIVGVLLTDVLEPNRGNPVSWPGSHHETRQAFSRLGKNPTEAALSQLIADQCTTPINAQPQQLIARAGTIVVMDHALHHGMASNAGTEIRHAAYFRLPWQGTNVPSEVLAPNHFAQR